MKLTYGVFLCFVTEHKSSTRAYFLDLTGNLINKWDLDNSCNCLVAGYDQNRKDLILAAKNGDVKAFTVRLVKSIIHVIYRTQIRIPRPGRSAPIQITTQDVSGSFLVLTVNGGISCWDTSQLECLWRIDATRFRCVPTKIFADKFGSDFAVLCVNKQTRKSQLEVWSPPRDFLDCGAHRFIRFEIPLKASVVSLSLETVGGDFGTALMVIQNNRHAQLWTLTAGNITQHCDLICTGEQTSFSAPNDLDVELKGHANDGNQEEEFLNLFSLGQGCFTDGFGCPANEVLYLGLSEVDFCLFALHSPTKGDLMWQDAIVQQTIADGMSAHSGHKSDQVSALAQFDTPLTRPDLKKLGGVAPPNEPNLQCSEAPMYAVKDEQQHQSEDEEEITVGETYSLSDFVHEPEMMEKSIDINGKVFAFTPTAAIPSLHESVSNPNSLVQLIKPRGLAMLSDNKPFSFPQLHRLTRAGMLLLTHPQDNIPVKSELEIDKVSIAHRSERMVCITDIKEGFVFDMKPFNNHTPPVKPIRLEVGISPNAKCTAILACDVFIKLPPEVLLDEGIKAPLEGSGMMGSHVLAMFGDSDGKIFYSLCSHTSVLQQGFIRAHAGPVMAIVSTGDCMKPIWKIGTSQLNRNSPQLQPTAMPGSAIVSMDCDGEVKVWQPLFSNSGVLRSKQSQILSIYQLSWYLSGIINTFDSQSVDTIATCCLDPTCTTVMIGFGSGRLQQWVIPGITSSGSNKAQVMREDVWESRKHGTTISSMRMWVNLPDTSVRVRSVDFSKLNDPKLSKSAKYAAMITDNTNIATTNENHIAYTLEDLRRIAENSTFVTAAKDNTIVLWRLFVAKAVELPSDLTELKSQRLFTQCRFLEPIKCQMFTVSATPTEALCYPLKPQGGAVYWRLSVLVGGILINVAQADKATLFLPKTRKKNLSLLSVKDAIPDFADTFKDDESMACTVLEFDSLDQATIDQVDPMPVVCEVVNPQRTVALMSLSGVPCRLSWKHSWQKDSLEIPVQNVFVDSGGDTKAIQLATMSPSQAHQLPLHRAAPTDMTDHIRSPAKKYTVGTSLQSPDKPAIKKVDKDALKKKQEDEKMANKGKSKAFKKAASKPLPTDIVIVEHAGVRMSVPASNVDHLKHVTPDNRTKKYYAPKNVAIGAAAVKESKTITKTMSSNFAGNIAPSIRPPSPPGGVATLVNMAVESPPGSRGGVSYVRSEVLNVEGHSSYHNNATIATTTTSSHSATHRIPSAHRKINDDEESFNDTIGNSIVDMDNIANDYMMLIAEDATKNDPLIKPKHKVTPQHAYTSKTANKSHLAKSIKQPYRSSHLGSVPAPQKDLQRGEYQNTRFVAKDKTFATTHHDDLEDAVDLKETFKFKMFMNPGIDSSEMVPSHTNLHKFSSKQEAEELSESYSYFKNPRNYFERLDQPVFYQKDTKERAEEARELRSQLDDMNTVMSEMSSDESGDENIPMDSEKVEKLKESMISSELQLYSHMSAADKEAFLKKKRRENQRVMRESKDAFKELAGLDLSGMHSSGDEGDDAAALTEAALKAKISSKKVLGWGSVKTAVNVGISMKAINEMISDSSKKKKKKTAAGGGKSPPANLNMKEFTTFARKLNQVIAENEVPPLVEVVVVDTLHDRVDLSIQGTKLGDAHIVVIEDTPSAVIPIASDFRNLKTLLFRYEGVVSITTEKMPHTDKVFLTLKDLNPSTRYKIVLCAEHNDGKTPCRNTNEEIQKSVLNFSTEEAPEENMDIEWGRLSNEQRSDELVAALCDLETQTKAENASIELPSSDDVEAWLTVVEENFEDEDLEAAELDEEGEASPYAVVKLFVNWWTNNDPEFGHSSHRSNFLSRESMFYFMKNHDLIHQCTDEKFLTIEQSVHIKQAHEDGVDISEMPEYLIFRSWLKGGRVMEKVYLELKNARKLEQFAELREELLRREAAFDDESSVGSGPVARSNSQIENSIDEGDESVDETMEEEEEGAIVSVTVSDSVITDNVDEEESNSLQRQTSEESAMANVDDLVYIDDFDEEDPREVQLKDRSERLVELAQNVEDSITLVNGLLMAQRHAEEEDLAIEDLERRRGLLRYEDVITIMAMKKLKELCDNKNIRPRDLDEANTQTVTGASTFVLVEESDLTPEEPPQATMLSLIGNAKRPLRNWENMDLEERVLEIQLACMLVDISELAVECGISVPNPEDGNILSNSLVIPARIKRWGNYEQWYVGNETSDNTKKRRPSLARIMFADWEKKSVKKDTSFQEILKKRPLVATKKLTNDGDEGSKIPPKLAKQKSKRMSMKRMSLASTNAPSQSFGRAGSTAGGGESEEDEIVKTYESVINKDASIRCGYMKSLLQVVLKSRNMGVLRLLLPPAWPGRMHSQFLFPRLGFITPCYTEPVERFQPNPSFSTESYSVAEVMLWFSEAELGVDDERMKVAEVEGKKRQAYLEWLAEEESRMLEGRIMMRREDLFSHHLRHHTHTIEVDPPKIAGDSAHKQFVHGPDLPGEYSHLKENDRYFEEKGSGIDNEDEVADILEKMRYEAESAIRAKKAMKKKMIEERKRKEKEEEKRQELLERDQRIEENKDRLNRLRKHLENLKESRLQEKLVKEMEIADAILQQEKEEQDRLEEKEKARLVRMEQAKMDNEIRQMAREDEIHHIQRDHLREFANMEHEDIFGLMVRAQQKSVEEDRLARISNLKAVYEEFIPYLFDKSQIRVPHLHIDDEPEEDSRIVLPEKIDWKMFKGSTNVTNSDKDDLNNSAAGEKCKVSEAEREKPDLNSVFCGNDANDAILEELLCSKAINVKFSEAIFESEGKKPVDVDSLKFWPRATNSPAITTPLVWKGPDKKNDKSKQLRKKERPYTQFNSSEAYLQKVLKVSDTNKIVFLETSTDNTLHSLGLEKELIRSFGQREVIVRLPPLNIKPNEEHSIENSKRSTSPKTSFMDPVVFRPSIQGLVIDSPSSKNIIQDYLKEDSLRGLHSSGAASRTISNAPNTYRVKTPKGKAKKDDKKSITSEKKALKEFINQTSLAALDPYYVEACKPGLRDSDSLSKKKRVSDFKVSQSLPEFKKEEEKDTIEEGNTCSSAFNDDDSVNDGGAPPSENSSIFNSVGSENREIVRELQNSLAESTSRGNNTQQQDLLDDDIYPTFAMDDPEFRITDRNVTYAPNHRPKSDSVYQQYEENHPHFYKKPFGVKGHVKPIDDSFIVRARKSAEAITAQKEKEERKEQRKLMKQTKEEQRKSLQRRQQKKQEHGTTVKSLHRDEYAALLRKSFEETSRQYDCGNVNFVNNKGL
jgi:hypothetical protein